MYLLYMYVYMCTYIKYMYNVFTLYIYVYMY